MMLVVNSPANEEDVRDAGLISGSRRSPVFLPGEPHGQRSLGGGGVQCIGSHKIRHN